MQDHDADNWSNGLAALEDAGTTVVADAREEQTKPTGGDGWQQYRRWISKAPAPRQRRGGIDPTLYTWKGYRSWTEQVKRNWPDKA